jgi:hypothetical protein
VGEPEAYPDMLPLHDIRFRSSPHVELRQLGELDAVQREALRELEDDPDCYGLFVAKPPLAMNVKSVSRPIAEIFRTLATPSRLGDLRDIADDVVDLVLDGVLEVESGDGFVSGADALTVVCGVSGEAGARGATAELSRAALLYAEDVATSDPHALAMALYFYNRIPLSPFWRARFPAPDAILAHLGADRGRLDREWTASHGAPGWFGWVSRTVALRERSDVTWKLYVSPRPEHIRDAFGALVRTLCAFPGASFKVANGAAGLLRPDKLMAYFHSREELDGAADALRRELAGCDAQGVPFTASLDEPGLLSWGVDPPDDARALRWLGRESWRLWLVQRLGAAMAIAKSARSASAIEPWRFAVARARRHGVDVETWTPSATLWSRR